MKNPQRIPVQELGETELHIASLAVHVTPAHLPALLNWLAQQPEVEIHADDQQGKLVLVTESHNTRHISQLIDTLNQMTGVISAALVYHEIITGEHDAP